MPDIGPVYYPDDEQYLIRWHTARGDTPSDPEDLLASTWTDEAGEPVDPADFPLAEEK